MWLNISQDESHWGHQRLKACCINVIAKTPTSPHTHLTFSIQCIWVNELHVRAPPAVWTLTQNHLPGLNIGAVICIICHFWALNYNCNSTKTKVNTLVRHVRVTNGLLLVNIRYKNVSVISVIDKYKLGVLGCKNSSSRSKIYVNDSLKKCLHPYSQPRGTRGHWIWDRVTYTHSWAPDCPI